jgi:hypothetical protein
MLLGSRPRLAARWRRSELVGMNPRRAIRIPVFLLLPVLSAGCARERRPLAVADVSGCWSLQWLDADTVVGVGTMPDSVRLDTVVTGRTDAPHRDVRFAGRAVPSDTLRPGDRLPWYRAYATSWWRMGAGDSIRIVFNDHWTRYETDVRVTGDRMAGTAVFRSDYEPVPPPMIAVRGERFPCPSAP